MRAAWLLALAACAHRSPGEVVRDDLAARDPNVRWPDGFAPETADLFAHNELEIHAPCAQVWAALIAAPRWPTWYANARDVQLDAGGDVLTAGTRFRWVTFGLAVTSEVHELVENSRLAWFGHADGLDAYHAWSLAPAGDGCRVVTEETSHGAAARALRDRQPRAIHDGHDGWLRDLQRAVERR